MTNCVSASRDDGMKKRGKRVWLSLAIVLGLLTAMFPLVGGSGSPAHAAACTDNATTYYEATMVSKYIELRGSKNCLGTAWIRWNPQSTLGDAYGTLKFQVADACGGVSDGESNYISSVGGAGSHITAFKSTIVRARLVYTAQHGSPASFTTRWFNVGAKPTVC